MKKQHRFLLLSVICILVLFSTACNAAWVTAYPALVAAAQAALTAIGAFIAALAGLPESAVSGVQKILNDAKTQLGNSVSILQAAAGDIGSGILSEIQTILQAVQQNVQSILSGLSISNPSSLSKYTGLVQLAIAAIEAVLAILPAVGVAIPKLAEMSDADKQHLDTSVTNSMKAAHKALQHNYVEWLRLTGDAETDEAILAARQAVPSIP